MAARQELAEARERVKGRKMDTRRKVILGGGLIGLARAGEREAQVMIDKIVAHQEREPDRKAFDGWSSKGTVGSKASSDQPE